MGTPDLDALKSTLVNNNTHAGWCTVAVFVGLLVEYTILLWPKWRELKRWKKLFTVLAGIAIAGGVYGEYLLAHGPLTRRYKSKMSQRLDWLS